MTSRFKAAPNQETLKSIFEQPVGIEPTTFYLASRHSTAELRLLIGAGDWTRTSLSSLEGWGTTSIPHPLMNYDSKWRRAMDESSPGAFLLSASMLRS